MSVGTGINNNCGLLGIGLDQFVSDKVSVMGAAGIGSWGYKLTGGFRYYLNESKTGSAFGLSYSYATGVEEVELDVDIQVNATSQTGVKDLFKLNPASAINLSWMRFWSVGTKGRLNLELGYSINISGQDNFESVSKPFLTSQSKRVINMLQPGGLILGLGFSYGL